MESTFSAELVEPGETAGNAENAPSVSVSAGRHTTENVAAIPRIRDDSIGAGAKLAGLVDDPGS